MKKLFYRLFGIKRYFFVSFMFNDLVGKPHNGSIIIVSTGGLFVSKEKFCKIVADDNHAVDINKILINNMIEISKSDYKDY